MLLAGNHKCGRYMFDVLALVLYWRYPLTPCMQYALVSHTVIMLAAKCYCCTLHTPVYSLIDGVIVTHCHADHDAGAFQKILFEGQVTVITTPTIYGSFIRKYSALSGLPPALLRQTHRFLPATIGETLRVRGASLNFFYTLHSIPCIGLEVCVLYMLMFMLQMCVAARVDCVVALEHCWCLV
jgi:hypothetical protein